MLLIPQVAWHAGGAPDAAGGAGAGEGPRQAAHRPRPLPRSPSLVMAADLGVAGDCSVSPAAPLFQLIKRYPFSRMPKSFLMHGLILRSQLWKHCTMLQQTEQLQLAEACLCLL